MGAFYLFLLACSLVLLVGATGRIGMGFQLPGMTRPLSKKYKKILRKYFLYYTLLDRKQQRLFERKVQYFIYHKEFIPRQMTRVTDEMKVLISACAVQLTFGYPGLTLRHFKRILVYPDNYYSTINKVYHKGEVNPRLQAIVLSWRSFVQGYLEHNSGVNLGLHEMAHAIRLENLIFNGEHDFFEPQVLKKWEELASLCMAEIQQSDNDFFRDYAATNKDEFFAIAIENFFERPVEFKKNMPDLYAVLCKLMKQDPGAVLSEGKEG